MSQKRVLPLVLALLLFAAAAQAGEHPVYSGPGEHFLRSDNGQAAVRAEDVLAVRGLDGDWALIEYAASDGASRWGYIPKEALLHPDDIAPLSFLPVEGVAAQDRLLLDDPYHSKHALRELAEGTPITLLCIFDHEWVYVAVDDGLTAPARGFIPLGAYDDYANLWQGFGHTLAPEGQLVPVYASPDADAPVLAHYYGGVFFAIAATKNGFTEVRHLDWRRQRVQSGYLRTEALQWDTRPPQADAPLGYLTAAAGEARIGFYATPGEEERPRQQLPPGVVVEVLGRWASRWPGWLHVSIGYRTGYVLEEHVRIEADTRYVDFIAQPHEEVTVMFAPDAEGIIDKRNVSLHDFPDASIASGGILRGSLIACLADLGDWCQVYTGEAVRFIESRFLTME
ncbi:MAG: hypothetical protein LBN04_03825 [Oscillospiraceae bacterium]|nr:hypothetical protein [Oscillospiraceae bacterium]